MYPQFSDTNHTEQLYGVYRATVSNIEDPEELARVKLEFPWRDADDESNWARIAVPMAGGEMGTYFLPEVGDEVLVAFENGDIHSPYVVGSLWNGDDEPPESHDDGANDVRSVTSRSGHEIALDDGDEPSVTITTAADQTVTLDDDGEEITIEDANGNTITMGSAGVTISSGDKITLSANDIVLDAKMGLDLKGNEVGVEGKTAVDIESKANMELDSMGMLDIGATGMMKIQSSAILTIKGSLIQLN